MEKIITINLGGRVIAIEDAAYNSLKAYFESLRRYFEGEESRDEIINDIESRAAELMEAKLKRGAGAITEADVEEIIAGIGRVEDFAAEEEAPPRSAGAAPQPKHAKRFYRDANDKILGGVCSGLAAYLNVDPTLVRIVFAILTLGGWGFGVMLYILLWIFVPAQPMEGYRGRRLYRNTDDKWLGGVASGLAAYFGQQAWVFRLLFVAPVILSIFTGRSWWLFGSFFFGSLTGTFVLIYIVLWVVLPAARSPFEKMEMRGEKVDLNSIRQNIAANTGDIKNRVKDWSGEVSDSAKQFMNTRGKAFGREVSEAARNTASRGGSVLGTLFKAIFMFIAIGVAFVLFMVLIGYSFGGFSRLANDFILQTPQLRALGWCTVLLLLGVPLLAIVMMIARRALRIRGGSRVVGAAFVLLWIAGFVCAGFLTDRLLKQFMYETSVQGETVTLAPRSGSLVVAVPEDAIEYSNSLPWLRGDIQGWDVQGDLMHSAHVLIQTGLSPDSLYHVSITRLSHGASKSEARDLAYQIDYGAHLMAGTDSLLALPAGYTITKAQGYRGQRVVVNVQVPAGKKIRFDGSVDDKLWGRHSYMAGTRSSYSYGKWRVRFDEEYESVDWNSDVDYIMSADGRLVNALHPQDTLDATRYYVRKSYGPGYWRYERRERHERRHRAERRMDSIDREIERLEAQKERMDERDY